MKQSTINRRRYAVHWTFGTVLWSTFVLFFWVSVIWMFISLFADVIRRDMSGWAKAGWLALMVFFPFFGMLVYVIARPRNATAEGAPHSGRGVSSEARAGYYPADEIATAAQLHDRGSITDVEYERIKQHALSA
jgi:signal transduction histidine kinase